jgi:hypothetical protein
VLVAALLVCHTIPRAPAARTPLDRQLRQVWVEVRRQLMTHGKLSRLKAGREAAIFTDSLKGELREPLTDAQFHDVLRSLGRRHFWRMWYYPDATELEAHFHSLVWTDMIRLYLQRKPMTAEEAAILNQQVETLVSQVRGVMAEAYGTKVETAEAKSLLKHVRDNLRHEMLDPVSPVLKRPFTQAELDDLEKSVIAKMRNARGTPDQVFTEVASLTNYLSAGIWRLQYRCPRLDPALMQQMQAERHARFQRQHPDPRTRGKPNSPMQRLLKGIGWR